MGNLQKKLVEHLISLTPEEKREIANRIVQVLGGDPTPQVTGLPQRRGHTDGGIDGRIPIRIKERIIRQKLKRMLDGSEIAVETVNEKFTWVETQAGFNIKIEKDKFSRKTLNAFVEDLRREHIFAGVIITAVELSPDAQAEFQRHNSNNMDLCHILLENLLSGDISCPNICFVAGDISENIIKNLREFIKINE
ncbi:hypothetical protein [Sphaerospermopsis torques-reginae]|uniref:Uncharacterized protein n=1 Tax=Sphaerospermopsis torques-reginae ITEP-024 TaxID=984208 RepID=A0ABX8WW17_9CYAN|nr:hypothetical protein [Sphaerospermopsis torques-reginae]QYX30612.1 hypothetical protein K2F26_17205 [Sphaerospermopsis torques-reginae ITEP-024]